MALNSGEIADTDTRVEVQRLLKAFNKGCSHKNLEALVKDRYLRQFLIYLLPLAFAKYLHDFHAYFHSFVKYLLPFLVSEGFPPLEINDCLSNIFDLNASYQ